MNDTPISDPRTELAGKRTMLASFRTAQALDRTTLAWVRTTFTMGSFGVGMIGFSRTLLAGASYWSALRRMARGELPKAARWPLSITIALFVALLGMAGLWRLARFVTGWALSSSVVTV